MGAIWEPPLFRETAARWKSRRHGEPIAPRRIKGEAPRPPPVSRRPASWFRAFKPPPCAACRQADPKRSIGKELWIAPNAWKSRPSYAHYVGPVLYKCIAATGVVFFFFFLFSFFSPFVTSSTGCMPVCGSKRYYKYLHLCVCTYVLVCRPMQCINNDKWVYTGSGPP